MRLPAKIVVGLLPLCLTGCVFHRKPQAQAQNGPIAPVIVDNPPLPPATASVNPPESTIPPQPTSAAPTPPKQQPKKKPANRPAATPAAPVPASATQQAANPAPSVSAIGQLSSGDGDSGQQTAESINAIERGLNSINRPLNDNEQKTADHLREFLRQARAALSSGDLDGARTLAGKARILLNELTQ